MNRQANYPIAIAAGQIHADLLATLEGMFPGRVRQHEDCFYVDGDVSESQYREAMSRVIHRCPPTTTPLSQPDKVRIANLVRKVAADHVLTTPLFIVQQRFGSPDQRHEAHKYAREVLQDLARICGPRG